MTLEDHRYSVYLNDQDPCSFQPPTILKELKPHQRTALSKCIEMETKPFLTYHVPNPEHWIRFYNSYIPTYTGTFQVQASIGIIGDIVGYGKTLIALSLIASQPLSKIYVHQQQNHSYGSSHFSASMSFVKERTFRYKPDDLIHTTLTVVPKGPVFIQWKQFIEKDTQLKCLIIDSLHTIKKLLPKMYPELKQYLEQYDMVLIKSTTLKVLVQYYEELESSIKIHGFDRIMIDEAHDILYKIPSMNFNFIWLITSSYRQLSNYSNSKSIANHLDLIIHHTERIHYILVKNINEYVIQSFDIPKPIETYYLCRMDRMLTAISLFVNQTIRDKINVNDITGAVHDLGGTQTDEEGLVNLVKRDFIKDIQNKKKELAFIQSLDLEAEQKETRLRIVRQELNRLTTRYESLEERLRNLSTEMCPICMDSFENPIYLSCTHTVCGKCLFKWMQSSIITRQFNVGCPQCRTSIDCTKLVAVVQNASTQTPTQQMLSKEEHLIEILKKKPDGRFILFSRVDSQFYHLCQLLTEHNIPHSEMKGSTTHMMHILKDFKEGRLKIILLTTQYAGCGIDISYASDVIIYHKMPEDRQQAIGRAQRVGRTEQLTIHHLCYAHELSED